MIRLLGFLCAFACASVAIGAQAEERIPLIGRDGPEADGCGGIGRVSGLYAFTGEPTLAVRETNEDYAREKDRLPQGTLVWLCDAQEEWQGIVYASGDFQDLGDCRVSSRLAMPEPYTGPCRTGWVPARNLQLVAD